MLDGPSVVAALKGCGVTDVIGQPLMVLGATSPPVDRIFPFKLFKNLKSSMEHREVH